LDRAALQAKALAKNLDLVIRGQQPVLYATDGPPLIAVSLGRSKGTGHRGNMKFPSIIVCKLLLLIAMVWSLI
jgi:hypothetical protein